AALRKRAFEWRQAHARDASRTITQFRKCLCSALYELRKIMGTRNRIDKAPLLCTLPSNAIWGGAEDIRVVAPNLAFVSEARESSGAWQHAEQRHFGQADG